MLKGEGVGTAKLMEDLKSQYLLIVIGTGIMEAVKEYWGAIVLLSMVFAI